VPKSEKRRRNFCHDVAVACIPPDTREKVPNTRRRHEERPRTPEHESRHVYAVIRAILASEQGKSRAMRISNDPVKIELRNLVAYFFPCGQKTGMNEKLIFHTLIWNCRKCEVSLPVLFAVGALEVKRAIDQLVLRRAFSDPSAGIARVK